MCVMRVVWQILGVSSMCPFYDFSSFKISKNRAHEKEMTATLRFHKQKTISSIDSFGTYNQHPLYLCCTTSKFLFDDNLLTCSF